MHGVVTLLDDAECAVVEEVWADLRRQFGIEGVYATPHPHFSYQVAGAYDFPRVRDAFARVAEQTSAFTVQAGGLGIFPGPKPVVYIPVARRTELSAVHDQVWTALADAASDVSGYYRNEQWVPHITLACGDLDPQTLPDVVHRLHAKNLSWGMRVTNLAVLEDDGEEQMITYRAPLVGT